MKKMIFLSYNGKKMDLVKKEDVHLQPQYMHKVRCFNCGKPFTHHQTQELEKYKRVNKVLNRTFPSKNVDVDLMSYKDLEIFILELKQVAPLVGLNERGEPYPFSEALAQLFKLISGKATKKNKDLGKAVKDFVEKYRMAPFDIHDEDEDFRNTFEEFLQENFNLKRMCCKMHFQTPYMLSQGLTNQIVVPGYESRFTLKEKEPDIQDVENPMAYIGGEVEGGRKKAVRRRKPMMDEILTVENAHKGENAFATKFNDETMKKLKEERDNIARQKTIQQQKAILNETLEEGLDLLPPEDVAEFTEEYDDEKRPFQTPAVEKDQGRLNLTKVREEDKPKKAGRGRPRKEKEAKPALKKPAKK